MPVDAAPARDVADPRVKAALAMAPGVRAGIGMDADGSRKCAFPRSSSSAPAIPSRRRARTPCSRPTTSAMWTS
jgi:hypothetical protein